MDEVNTEALLLVIRQKDDVITECSRTIDQYACRLQEEKKRVVAYKADVEKCSLEKYEQLENEMVILKLKNESLKNELFWAEDLSKQWKYRIANTLTDVPCTVLFLLALGMLVGGMIVACLP